MINELEGLSILEDQRAGKQFYGAHAYQDWLNSKGLTADSEGWCFILFKFKNKSYISAHHFFL